MSKSIPLDELPSNLKKQLGIKSKNPNKEEIDRYAYKIIGLLADCSSRTVRTQALKKACKLHK